ncbi:hypothetical protein HOLDEFILI_01813 [Holdemania filiformis DSM 12042]|uniref:Uncharacterized protein n=1 Tax=Holdemania filiformis DSM 12042 TaxID=545696 RepID=B9Y7L8_9FIRM|nr:hypothetical protein HOLDEFILI_01813 [Holdemania filiformis DSM 12042]
MFFKKALGYKKVRQDKASLNALSCLLLCMDILPTRNRVQTYKK